MVACKGKESATKQRTRKDALRLTRGCFFFARTRTGSTPPSDKLRSTTNLSKKPLLERLVGIDSRQDKNATMKRTKEVCILTRYHAPTCPKTKIQRQRKKGEERCDQNPREQKHPKTLALPGAKNPAAALATKEKAVKKADADLAHVQKVADLQKKVATRILKEHMKAATPARRLKRS